MLGEGGSRTQIVCACVRDREGMERHTESERDGEGWRGRERDGEKWGRERETRKWKFVWGKKGGGGGSMVILEYDVNVSLNLNKKNVHYRKSTSIYDVPSNS